MLNITQCCCKQEKTNSDYNRNRNVDYREDWQLKMYEKTGMWGESWDVETTAVPTSSRQSEYSVASRCEWMSVILPCPQNVQQKWNVQKGATICCSSETLSSHFWDGAWMLIINCWMGRELSSSNSIMFIRWNDISWANKSHKYPQ